MDIRGIATFQVIVRTGSFQQAAKELKYAQSTVTKQIQNLEDDLGVKLLERGKSIRLTHAGEVFIKKADQLIRDFYDLQQTMTDLNDGEKGTVNIGIMEPTASYRIPMLIKEFAALYPNVEINIKIHNSHMFNQMVSDGTVDFAICATPESGLGTNFEPLFVEEIVLLLPKVHPLSKKKRVYLSDLQNEHILLTNATCPFRRKLETSLHEKGATPYRKIEIGNMAALKYYVQVQYGLAAVPMITVTPPPEGTVLKRIENLDGGLITGLLIKKDTELLSAAARKLASYLRQELSMLAAQGTTASAGNG
ncbi:LysR family transcriptional regulator [Paenibacillus sp. HWE-109]|uniref:LysR family transcriptional regulator n=1 Tax=Paenibacillus sp. HWE-109 TaxID=1306526 RepID=UPI001EDDDC12|nr:LysR family transcriptional regulator [Paenibacillus sp. HWE-109]UKS25672.1 LysR family transcriptional regulator [Paenibacillus sp. HWE-109]